MGRGGTGLSSFASALNGVAVISKKDRHHVTAGSFPSMAPYPPVRVSIKLIEATAELERSSGRTTIGEATTKDCRISVQQARRIAANIAKLPELLRNARE